MEKKDSILKPFVAENLFWIREPKQYTVTDSLITIVSEPHTDLWQRTYYGFSNDNAPVLQMKTSDKFFSFTVKTSFNSSALFDLLRLNPCINPPIVAPRKSISPALEIQPNLKVLSSTGR